MEVDTFPLMGTAIASRVSRLTGLVEAIPIIVAPPPVTETVRKVQGSGPITAPAWQVNVCEFPAELPRVTLMVGPPELERLARVR
jgi:hypothetical protein